MIGKHSLVVIMPVIKKVSGKGVLSERGVGIPFPV